MLPDIESLRCFDSVARHLSFRAAAAEVALSPAAFSDRMKRLEDQLGGPLLVRTTRRVALTEAGMRLLPLARRCLDDARLCLHVANANQPTPPFVLRVGTRFELGLSWLVPALPSLDATNPSRHLHLTFGAGSELLRMLENGQIDAAITSARLSLAGISYGLLHEEEYVFVASPRTLKQAPLKKPEDAAGQVLIDISGDLPLFRYFLDAGKREQAWVFSRIEFLSTIGAIRLRLLQGVGVAVLPRYSIRKDLAAGRLVVIVPSVKLATDWFRLIWKNGHPREAEFRDLARELALRPLT